jgi:hypothetical protein
MCDRQSTSKEHVPPLCLFPESKDVSGNFRRNLITVPSCDEHNSLKSADDEFLMVSLAGIIGNNSIGYRHKFSKVNRAIVRSAFSLLNKALRNQEWHLVEVAPNKFLDIVWGTPDHDRLNGCFDRIARGLYYRHFGGQFRGETRSILAYIPQDTPNPSEFHRLIRDKVATELHGKPRLGTNPDVFSFLFTDADQFGLRSLHLKFYGGLDVYVAMIPSHTELPRNIAMDFLNAGIHTIIRCGDEQYHFNVDTSANS